MPAVWNLWILPQLEGLGGTLDVSSIQVDFCLHESALPSFCLSRCIILGQLSFP